MIAEGREITPALVIAGYRPNAASSPARGVPTPARILVAAPRRVVRDGRWRARRFGPMQTVASKGEWVQVRPGQWRVRFVLACGHGIERGYRAPKYRCPACLGRRAK